MKVLFIYYIPSGGMETLNRMRNKSLKLAGIECHFLYHLNGHGLQNPIDAPIFITKNEKEIREVIQNGKYTAIVVSSDPRELQLIRSINYSGLLIYDIQGLGINKEFAYEYLQHHAGYYVNAYADAILSPETPHIIDAVLKVFPNKPRYHFHNCIDFNQVKYREGKKSDVPIVGWIGRIEPNKNWRDFLYICYMLKRKVPPLKFWMFEDSSLSTEKERKMFNRLVKSFQLENSLKIFDNQPYDMMPEYYSVIGDSGGFLCSTSKVEGFGYAILEALACRCPVLSSDSDGVRSFIIHDQTGKFYKSGKTKHAVEEGIDLLFNHEKREQIRVNGQKHALDNFSLETYSQNFVNMLNGLSSGQN